MTVGCSEMLCAAAIAAAIALLDGWTLDRAVRTKHAAVSRQRLEHSVTLLALVEPLARIGGHGLSRGGTTRRTGND